MFKKVGNCVVVDRNQAERLFALLGCMNVNKWDSDVLVHRLRRIAVFCSQDMDIDGEYKKLVDTILSVGPVGAIVLRNSSEPTSPCIPLTERHFDDAHRSVKRRSQGPRKRGSVFSFTKCGIPIGSTLVLKKDPKVTCKVVGDPWVVDFGDGVYESFTNRTKRALGAKESTFLSPMNYWMYKGVLLRVYYNKKQKRKKVNKT